MTDLTQQPTWHDGIYQIETTDPVLGGPPNLQTKAGLSNIQAQQLAERTLFLKQAIEAHVALSGVAIADDGMAWSSDGVLMINKSGAAIVPTGTSLATLEVDGLIDFFSHFADLILGEATPAGAIAAFAFGNPPLGWLECDGSAISRTAYADLFGAVGETFGVGDGAATFNIPDLRGQFLRGWDNGRGVDSGRSFGSDQGDAIRNISGSVTFLGATGSSETMNTSTTSGAISADPEVEAGATQLSVTTSSGWRQIMRFNASSQVPTAQENRPKNTSLMFCVKY